MVAQKAPAATDIVPSQVPKPPELNARGDCSTCGKSNATRKLTLDDGTVEIVCAPCLQARLGSDKSAKPSLERQMTMKRIKKIQAASNGEMRKDATLRRLKSANSKRDVAPKEGAADKNGNIDTNGTGDAASDTDKNGVEAADKPSEAPSTPTSGTDPAPDAASPFRPEDTSTATTAQPTADEMMTTTTATGTDEATAAPPTLPTASAGGNGGAGGRPDRPTGKPEAPAPRAATLPPNALAAALHAALSGNEMKEKTERVELRGALMSALSGRELTDKLREINPVAAVNSDGSKKELSSVLSRKMRRRSDMLTRSDDDAMEAFDRLTGLSQAFAWSAVGKLAKEGDDDGDGGDDDDDEEDSDDESAALLAGAGVQNTPRASGAAQADGGGGAAATDDTATTSSTAMSASGKTVTIMAPPPAPPLPDVLWWDDEESADGGGSVKTATGAATDGNPLSKSTSYKVKASSRGSYWRSVYNIGVDDEGRPALLPEGALHWVRATHAFNPTDATNQVSFTPGEWLAVAEMHDDGWLLGATLQEIECGKAARYFPNSFVNVDSPWDPSA